MAEMLAGEEQERVGDEAGAAFAFGDDIPCGHCRQPNVATRSFCGRCGERLWDTCQKCGARHTHGERFCGACGTDLEQLLAERKQRYEGLLEQANQFRREQEFDLALGRYKSLAEVEDPRLQSLAKHAAAMLEEVRAEKDCFARLAIRAEAEARQHVAEQRYAEAVALLERVPDNMRSEACGRLLVEARAKRDEVNRLTAEIQQRLQTKQIDGLGTRIDRLLALQPDQETIKRLAVQLRDRLLAAAQQKLADDDYSAALRALDQVPSAAFVPAVEKVRDYARELDCLIRDLRQSPVVTPALVAVAERLVKLRPEHPQAKGLLHRLRVLAQEPSEGRRQAAPAWAAVPQYRLGFPVHWLAGLKRIRCGPDIDGRLRKHPGQYFVACGLALQGLEQAAVPVNLLPARESGFLGKLPNVFRKPPQSAWGLDLGTTSLKAVRMTYNRRQTTVTLDAVERIDYLQDTTGVADDVERRRLEKEAIRQLLERRSLEGERVCVGVSGSFTLGRFLEVPPVDPKLLDETVRREADFQFPLDLSDLAWGHHVFPRPAVTASQPTPYRLLMQAVKRFHLHQVLSVCQDAGVRVDVVQSDCVALHNLAVYEFFGDLDPDSAGSSAVALLEVGARATNLVISSPQCIWFRTIGVAGEVFTNVLLRPLKLTRAQAEELKRSPARARRVYQVYDLLEPDVEHLVEEVERSLRTFRRQFRDIRIQQMYGIGGGFQLHGLLRHLCQPQPVAAREES